MGEAHAFHGHLPIPGVILLRYTVPELHSVGVETTKSHAEHFVRQTNG
jgi:hypothetical protein